MDRQNAIDPIIDELDEQSLQLVVGASGEASSLAESLQRALSKNHTELTASEKMQKNLSKQFPVMGTKVEEGADAGITSYKKKMKEKEKEKNVSGGASGGSVDPLADLFKQR